MSDFASPRLESLHGRVTKVTFRKALWAFFNRGNPGSGDGVRSHGQLVAIQRQCW